MRWWRWLLSLFGLSQEEPEPPPAWTEIDLKPTAPPTDRRVSLVPEKPPLYKPPGAEPTLDLPPEREAMPLPFPVDKKRIIQSILSVFETGKTEPSYGTVVVLKDGAGITYGKHQSTDGGESSLDTIVLRYIDRKGRYADALKPYISVLASDATAKEDPDNLSSSTKRLMDILKRAGEEDPIMAQAQDEVFDEHYWDPAAAQAQAMGLVLPLSWLVCYDTTIHSGVNGIANIRKRFREVPPASGGHEETWTRAYLQSRREWLATHPKTILHGTVYRIDAMLAMVAKGNWQLDTPIEIRKPRATVT